MAYSNINPAWDRMQKGKADAQREREVELARAVQKAAPWLTWGDCLRHACAKLAKEART